MAAFGEPERIVYRLDQGAINDRGYLGINQTITLVDADGNAVEVGGGGGATSWNDITGKPATFAPTIGTTANTAKAGNYVPAWGDVTGKPATFAPVIGTTATTAKAGNYQPAWGEVTGKPEVLTKAASAPAGADSPGTPGQIFYTADTFYICVAANTWRQCALTE